MSGIIKAKNKFEKDIKYGLRRASREFRRAGLIKQSDKVADICGHFGDYSTIVNSLLNKKENKA